MSGAIEVPALLATAAARRPTKKLVPDAHYTRRQRWHIITDSEGNMLHGEYELVDLLRWSKENGISTLELTTSDGISQGILRVEWFKL